jgi:hypothetical protein
MRLYAIREGDGKRMFVGLKCEGCGIEASLPIPDGWIKRGQDWGPGTDKLECEYCPNCPSTQEGK